MALINSIASWLMKKRMHQIELFMKYPHEVQRESLNRLIKSAKDTEWGNHYDYNSIQNLNQFKERVPIQDYETLKPFIERIRKGEQQILWHSDINWFAKSSGTTNDKSKFIPISMESLEDCHFKGGKDMLTIYFTLFPDSELFTGKSLTLAGSLHNTNDLSNAFDGDLSAVILQNLPMLAEFARTPSADIALINGWEEKIEKLATATISENVTSLVGVPSWMLILLRYILAKTDKKSINEVWPNLEVFFHGGVNFTPYAQHFSGIISSNVFYQETYNASEGFFGIQDQKGCKDLLLMLDYGIYYEFIPLGDYNNGITKTIPLDEVKLGEDYAIVISTNAGLWRYQIGDTVQFTSISPYRIKIVGRTKHFINAFGEELMIDNAENALRIACEKTNSSITEYTAAPIYFSNDDGGAHQWLIEFEDTPENLDYFGVLLDNALKGINSDYEAKRYNDMVLKPPVIKAVPKLTFFNWLKSKNKLGGQYKVPRLVNDRKIVEEILSQIS